MTSLESFIKLADAQLAVRIALSLHGAPLQAVNNAEQSLLQCTLFQCHQVTPNTPLPEALAAPVATFEPHQSSNLVPGCETDAWATPRKTRTSNLVAPPLLQRPLFFQLNSDAGDDSEADDEKLYSVLPQIPNLPSFTDAVDAALVDTIEPALVDTIEPDMHSKPVPLPTVPNRPLS